jgi:hypothetical protein
MTSHIDFASINAAALASGRVFLETLIPGGKFRSLEYQVRNPTRDDKQLGSFSINYKTGVWKDFATGDRGGDLISLWAYVRSIRQGEAARELADKLGITVPSTGNGAVPLSKSVSTSSADTTPPKSSSWGDDGPPRYDNELRRHSYKADGVPVKIKLKFIDGNYTQLYRVFDGETPKGWQAKKPDGFRPVPYVTDALPPFDPALADDQILWAEGERDVDTIGKLNLPAFTFGGVGDGLPDGIASYLTGRHIVILADNDDAGRAHAEKKAALAREANAASVRVVEFPELPPKADVSDFIETGGTIEQLYARVTATPEWEPTQAVPNDDNRISGSIARLAFLNPIEREQEIRAAAKEFGVPVATVRQAVKQTERNTDTKGQGRPLDFPKIEPWSDPVNGAELLTELCAALRRYTVYPSGSAETTALWAVHTHAFKCFGYTPRLAITSPEKGCGKTTTLDVLFELVARPLSTSNATVSVVFRAVEMAAPTLLIDEADTFLKENDELRGILNSGNRKGGQVARTVGDDHEPRQFSTWAPAAIAMIGRLPDTLEDRSVIVRLRRKKPTERVKQFRSERADELRQLARKIARWVADNMDALAENDPDTGALSNRAADNWRPLLAIADLAGGKWPTTARDIAEAAEITKQDQSARIMLLIDVKAILEGRPEVDRIGSTDLAIGLGAIEGRPWAEWRNGKPITPTALAKLLAPFEILPGTRRSGADTFKGYLRADFDEAFSCYLGTQTVTPSQSNNHGHCDGLQSVTLENDVTVSKSQRPNHHGHCDGVTLSGGNGGACAHCRQPEAPAAPLLQVGIDGYRVHLHRGCIDGYAPELNNGGNSR